MIKEEGLQDISRALTHMLFRNVPLVEEIHTKQLIADKYLINDMGYETGLTVLHRMGLTSQMPRERVVASNRASDWWVY